MRKFFSTRYSDFSFNLGIFLLRVGFSALLFIHHGLPKLMKFAERKDKFSDPLGIGHTPSLILIIFAEAFCAALVAFGLLTRFAAFVIAAAFAIIVFIHHRNDPVREYEDAILYLLVYLFILFCGPGKWSLDRLIGK